MGQVNTLKERQTTHVVADTDLFGKVLVDVVRAINGNGDSSLQLSEALERVREFFFFGSAFIYEADPQKKFVLKEHAAVFELTDRFQSWYLEDILSPEQIQLIIDDRWHCANEGRSNNREMQAICDYFELKSVILYFIVDETGTVNGCVGLSDKREHASFTDVEYQQMKTLFGLISQFAHVRITQQRLEYTMNSLENIVDHLGFDIYVNDFYNHDMLFANQSMAAPYGGWENMKGKACHEALYDGQSIECDFCPKQHLIDEEGNPTKTYVWDYKRPFDGTWFRVICAAFTWVDGRLAQVISSTDITDAKKNELLIEKMAFSDQLTGMPNRRKLEQDFKGILEASGEESKIFVFFLDLDGFKEINDTYGHAVGDALLCHLSGLFENNPLTAGHSYRYGGDEFIFMFDELDQNDIDNAIDTVLDIIQTPFTFNGTTVISDGSIGYAIYPDEASSFWNVLDKADGAMYTRKTERKLAKGETPR